LSPQIQSKRAVDKVVLPLNGRDDGMPAESVFTSPRREDISIVGEIFRKMIHLGAIAIPIGYLILGIKIALMILFPCLLFSLAVDYIRIFGNYRSKSFVYRYLGIMIRPSEKKDLVGGTYIFLGSILTIIFFDKPVALAAISFIVVGDTAGAIIGRLWGLVRFRGKSLEGSVSFFLACCLVAVIIPGIPFWVKIAGAVTATVVEAITLHIDDNLIVPITAGALMQLIVSQMVILQHFT
jgi:dolichol kinase